MTTPKVIGEELTSAQQSNLFFNFEENENLWLILLKEYFNTHGEFSESLKEDLINNSMNWQSTVEQITAEGYDDIVNIIQNRTLQWKITLKTLLQDKGHVNILQYYLKFLIGLKTSAGKEIGHRAASKKQINTILSVVSDDALASLDQYNRACEMLGKDHHHNPSTKAFYSNMQSDAHETLAALIGIIFLFKNISKNEDVEKLQDFIRKNLIMPLRTKEKVTEGRENEVIRKKIRNYEKLLSAVEINFS
jgi:hypothetical protein